MAHPSAAAVLQGSSSSVPQLQAARSCRGASGALRRFALQRRCDPGGGVHSWQPSRTLRRLRRSGSEQGSYFLNPAAGALGRGDGDVDNGGSTSQVPRSSQVPVPVTKHFPTEGEGNGGSSLNNGPIASSNNSFNGVFLLLLLNVAAFVADHLLKLPAMRWLYLDHSAARWYQFVTATFCHASWHHLSSNLFFLYIFGRLVEEEEGSVGLWATYLVTGAGGYLVSWLLLPSSVMSVGASGAVFGLFAVSVLTRLRFNWRKLLEVVILGQYVIERLIVEAQNSTWNVGARGLFSVHSGVNHVAHLGGALVGVLLMWLVSKLPEPQSSKAQKPRSP